MIQLNNFERVVTDKLGRDISKSKNLEQNKSICASLSQSLFIVAGSGKEIPNHSYQDRRRVYT